MKFITTGLLITWISMWSLQADQFDTLRSNWISQLTTAATNASSLSSISSTATKWQGQMVTSGTSYLFSDLPIGSSSANIVSTYSRLQAMAQAYATQGCTNYQTLLLGRQWRLAWTG